MKYAFMTWSTPKLSLDKNLQVAAQLGYDGIEARMSGKVERYVGDTTEQAHGIELYMTRTDRREARTKIADSGVELCCIATSVKYADPETHAEQIESTLRSIDLAYDLDCRRIRVFGGAFPNAVSRSEAADLLEKGLSAVADYAADGSVEVCIETHDAWSDPRDLLPVLQNINHPSIRINWDFAHPTWRADLDVAESFEIVKPWIGHVHIHDMTFTDETFINQWIGDGILDHGKAIRLLTEMDYQGYMSGEWINREPDWREHLAVELGTLKTMELKQQFP